ncbi:hypothetical protein CANMA_000299 [Candida margitis]|uniref:uncharacterized protein n=1 Tax=Candida margitis TaxID=1775924 RepID=UPI002226E896|nr:uncharacterized protein CANMA_000299 [Candida margitis]KAI5970708.1 hypothetical protein CANMA_000299 [Candida margitis]
MPSQKTIKESKTDVLIIGAGPSGLMCALWLTRCGIPCRIIDKRAGSIFAGQADGLQSRSFEIFQSFSEDAFDFVTLDKAWKSANHMMEMSFWSPNEEGKLARKSRIPDFIPGISRFHECVIHQGKIENWLNTSIDQFSEGKVKVERPYLPISIKIDETMTDDQDYAVEVLVKKLDDDLAKPEQYGNISNGLFRAFEGDQDKFYADHISDGNVEDFELIKAKYVLGSDGAHSWVRKQLDIEMQGETTDFIWGVIDMVPITNFPDIRSRCAIHSKDCGSMMIIPRENDLCRLYIQLKEVVREEGGNDADGTKAKGRIDRSKITPESIVKQAKEIIQPFELDVTDVSWFTGYQIGQRIATGFHRNNRVFISGDACHTHSPKAGQGMNVSMQDAYNLGFKFALVCKGLAKSDILQTYELERKKVAHDLIEFDHKFSRLFSGKPMVPHAEKLDESNDGGVDLDEFHQVYLQGGKFASGTISDYQDSIMVKKAGTQSRPGEESEGVFHPLANKVAVGRRLQSDLMLGQIDYKLLHLGDKLVSDGRFRLLIFPGDLHQHKSNWDILKKFNDVLESKDSFLKRYTPVNAFPSSVIEILTIHASQRHDIEFHDFPQFTHAIDFKGRTDYWRIFSGAGKSYDGIAVDIYKTLGIDKKDGAMLIVRPDSHVAQVVPFSSEGLKLVDNYFSGFMIDQSNCVLPEKDKTVNDAVRFVQPRLAV